MHSHGKRAGVDLKCRPRHGYTLLKAAPTGGNMPAIGGAAGGLASAAAAFSKLDLKPEMVSKVVPLLTSYVTKAGGPEVGRLLSSVLK